MKKLMKLFVLVAAAAMALASCQKNEIPAPEKQEVHFTINAGIPQTKTTITDNGDGAYTPSWNKGDEIGIFFTEPEEKVTKVDATFANTNEDGEIASFEGTASVKGEGTFYAFYPQSSFNQHYGDGTVRLDLPAAQKPTSTSFDPSCDILVAQPCDYLADGETVVINDLFFARLMSVLKINLLGEFAKDEVVESISFTVGGDNPVDITGNAKIDYKTATIKAWNNGSVKRNVVTATYSSDDYITVAGTNKAAFFVVAPVTIPAGAELAFTIKTKNYNISKTVTAPSDMSFYAGNVAVINLTIEEVNCEEIISDTRIWVEGFDDETENKQQTTPNESGVAGTGVSEELKYAYSNDNCNVRINTNGQTSTNPFLYINAANASFTVSNIQITNEENLALSAMIKGSGLKLTVEYKESTSSTWSKAGIIIGTNSYAIGRVVFAAPENATSLDIRLTGNGVIYVDDIVLEATEEAVPVVTLTSISLSNKKTEYLVGEEFTKPTVTAIYSDDTTTDVTEFATFSECDMNTAGEKTVIVTYEEKTAEYIFFVKEQGAAPEVSGWVATSFSNLKAGDQVVIVGTKSSKTYAMSNDKGTSDPPLPVEISISGDKLVSEPATNIVWHVGVDGNNRIFNTDATGNKWLYCTAANNGVRVGTNTAKAFAFENSYLKHVGTGRYLGIYNTQDWRCYTSHTTTNIANQTFTFFVKSGESGGNEGGGTTDSENPTPDVPGNPSTGESKTATITFGSNDVEISSASVTGSDSEGNTWAITTVGTTSFTSQSTYYQVGSSKNPATSITFTTTLPATASVSDISAKFGGFSGTAGNVTLKVGDTSVGTGNLNASTDVDVTSTSTATGNVVTVTVTGISKGVKCYNISVTYTE